MESYLDRSWEIIYQSILTIAAAFDSLVSYLNFLGPVFLILVLAIVTAFLTGFLKKHVRTQRLATLESEFQHWLSVREEALKQDDREKGRQLAKNIDQAHLNRAYYDFFLEGLLLNFLTLVIPVLAMVSYINEYYQAERLLSLFGQKFLFQIGGATPIEIGAVFWFVVSFSCIKLCLFITDWRQAKRGKQKVSPRPQNRVTHTTSIMEGQ